MSYMNKKGFGIIIFALVVLVMMMVVGSFFLYSDPYLKRVYEIAETKVESNMSQTMITNASASHSSFFDAAFMFLFIGLWAAGLIIGYYSDYGRFALVFLIFCLAILLFAAGIVTDYWDETLSVNDNIATRASYPMTYFLLDQLAVTLLVVIGSSILVSVMKDNL